MKQKHVDASREVRLWISQILMPIIGVIMVIPDSRNWIVDKYKEIMNKLKSK